jgi:hypothetical protein
VVHNPGLDALGSQMAQAWQQGLDAWWRALLSDPARLDELATCLARAGVVLPASHQAKTEDLASMVQAFELLEHRLTSLEGQVRTLTDHLGRMMEVMEALDQARMAAQIGQNGEPSCPG